MTESILPKDNIYADTQPAVCGAPSILRGVQRTLRDHAFTTLSEIPLANGRRADVMAVNAQSAIWIVEIKSSIADFRADHKWPEYRAYCDALFFAVTPAFPVSILPTDAGLILADHFGGEIVRVPNLHPLAAARRKSLILSFGMIAARRLHALADPPEHLV